MAEIAGCQAGSRRTRGSSSSSTNHGVSPHPLLVVASCLLLMAMDQPFSAGAACDISQGKWVPDERNLPRYSGRKGEPNYCPYIRPLFNCDTYRDNDKFQKFRWQPNACSLRPFRPSGWRYFMRRRRLLLVGDSIMANFYETLVCNIASGGYQMQSVLYRNSFRRIRGYRFTKFNFEINFLFSSYLTRATKERNPTGLSGNHGYIVDTDVVDPLISKIVPRYDVVVFSSGPWWLQNVPGRYQPNKFRRRGVIQKIPNIVAHARSLYTLRSFIQRSGFKGVPFFLTFSPRHHASFGPKSCGASKPITWLEAWKRYKTIALSSEYLSAQLHALKGGPIKPVPVTRMSQVRPDGHMGRYVPRDLMTPTPSGDCTHWCVPGVLDGWVDMLYTLMLKEPKLLKLRRG